MIAKYGLGANKALGQNFLFDLNLTRRIARAAAPLAGFAVVEIGPGPGGLTRALFAEGAEKIIVVERDERAVPALAEIAAAHPGKLDIHAADALDVDWRSVVSGPAKLVANLPYNIATPLLIGWLGDPWPPWYDSMTLMFQKEVAERIVAAPGTAAYGRLSVICQWRCKVSKLFDIHRSAFTPPPKVTSSVVQFHPRGVCEPPCRLETLERVTQAGFGQRRKMLRSSLKSLGGDTSALLDRAGISGELRAENLTVEDFARLAKLIDEMK